MNNKKLLEEFLVKHADTFSKAELYLCMHDEFSELYIDIDFKSKTIIIDGNIKLDYDFKTGELLKIYVTPRAGVHVQNSEEIDYE